jgi:hypothetical protein
MLWLQQAEATLYKTASFCGLKGHNIYSSSDATKQKTGKVYDFISMNFGKGPGS